MSEGKAFLEKVHIKNFLSLRNVELPFKPLTVLVGPNAGGKSNTYSALYRLHKMMVDEEFPSSEYVQDFRWVGEEQKPILELQTTVAESQTVYNLEAKPKLGFPPHVEQLYVDNIKVISIQDGKGVVSDENGENETIYNSDKLALASAGNYGNKPITRALAEFVKKWQFYDFFPEFMRSSLTRASLAEKEIREFPKLDTFGWELSEILWNWHTYYPGRFQSINDCLAASTNREIDQDQIDGQNQLCLLEGYKNPIPLYGASDGILRLIAYYILLNQPELPPLVAIEEPERNLHPGALKDIANVLQQLSERTQVIITTHSSQLLDAFNPDKLSDSLGVLLLRNRSGLGTEALNLEEIRDKREALDGWIADFGIGSAIFDSELLQDLMEEPT